MSEQATDAEPLSPGDRLADVVDFFGVQATGDELRWLLPISPNVANYLGVMHGGCALAAVTAAAETWSERPLAAASAQFMARVPLGGSAEVTFDIGSAGKRMTQVLAQVTDAADGRVLMRALLALGGRRLGIDQDWGQPPDVPGPDEWRRRTVPDNAVASFSTDADIRFGPHSAGDRRILCWARLAGTLASTRQGLIALADTLATGMHRSLGLRWRGSSIDNTVRIAGNADCEWVLLDIETDGFHNAVGHGVVRMYTPDGRLLATGNQSFAVARVSGPAEGLRT
ncbi:MAG: thioesterase family protein [Acidimicrobiaceae bacterium]|nr:thioesterase family protein [Acidimicrobiaceae bacterium]